MPDLADRIVEEILDDLQDRRGLHGAWDSIGEDIQDEIRHHWTALVRSEIERWNTDPDHA